MFTLAPCSVSLSRFRRLWFGAGLWLSIGAVVVNAAINSQNRQSAGPASLTVNGVDCGYVFSVQGGDPVGDVVTENSIGGAAPQKHLSGKHYAPLAVELNLPPGAVLADWITDLCAGRNSPKTVVLTETDYNRQVSAVTQFNNALLSEVTFPDLSANVKGIARVKILIAVSDRQALATTSAPAPTPVTTSTANNAQTDAFQFQLGTLNPNASRVAGFTLKRGVGGGVTTSAVPVLPNLILTFNVSLATDWVNWCTDFVVNGNSGAGAEKSGSLIFEAADQHPVFTLQLGHVGIVRATPLKISADTETIRTVEVELYVETASASLGPVGASTDSASANAPSPSPTPTTRLATRETTLNSLLAKKETITAGIPSGSAADQGGQDPKNFPRAPNLTRKTYLSFAQSDAMQEMATYSSTDRTEVLEDFYTKQLKSAGWTAQTHFDTSGANNARQFMGTWKTETRNAMISVTQADDGVTVTISVSSPPTP